MKLSFNTFAYGSSATWLPAYPLEEVIKRLSKIGYDGIELGAASPHAWPGYLDKKRREEINKILSDHNIVVSSICAPVGGGPGFNPASSNDAERKAFIKLYKECIDLCVDLNSHIIIWVGGWLVYGVSKARGWNLQKEALIECANYAQDKNVTIVIEPIPADADVIETADEALQLMEEIRLPRVKVMFDTFHANHRNEPMADYVRKMGQNLAHVHISDTDRLPPGKGNMDFRPLIQTLNDINFNGFLTLEIGFNTRAADPDLYALQGYEYLKSIM